MTVVPCSQILSLELDLVDKYEIEIDGAGHGHIIKNGENMEGAKSFVLRGGVNQATTIDIEFTLVEAKAIVEIEETTDIESSSRSFVVNNIDASGIDPDRLLALIDARIKDISNRGV